MGFTLYVEDSGYKGRHGWLFFDEELEAAFAIQLGQEVMKRAGGPSQGMIWELFPMGKSERHKSLIKLPLGINRKSNRRCLFLNEENQPLPDQALLLKTIRKAALMDVQGVFRDMLPAKEPEEEEQHTLPPALEKMIESCKVIRHLMKKAEDTNYLNHYERMCLLYTLSFAGDEGRKLLHRVISHCINYNYQYTQRQIERRKESPMSCPKIMEIFPELTESLPCDCKFDVPPRGYPSPVLYILEAEMEKGKIMPELGREVEEEPQEEQAAEEEAGERQEERILDFERIFSDEWNQEAGEEAPQASPEHIVGKPEELTDQRVQTADQPGSEDAREIGISPGKEAPAVAEQAPAVAKQTLVATEQVPAVACGQALDEPNGRAPAGPCPGLAQGAEMPPAVALETLGHEVREKEESIAKILGRKEHASQETEQLEVWRTALEYLRLRYNEERVTQGLNEVTDKLEELFKDRDTDSIETRLGIIRRVRSDEGKTGWVVIGG